MPTSTINLVANEWQDVGLAPCFLQVISDEAVTFIIGNQAPASTDVIGHLLGQFASFDLGAEGQKVFARGLSGPAQLVVSR